MTRRGVLAALVLTTLSIAVTVGWAAPTAERAGADIPSVPVGVVSSVGAQTIDGIGASGGWWPNQVGHFDPVLRSEVARLLFSNAGIALSQYRYNIGGGGVGVNVAYKAAPSFLVRPGVYNWSADPGGMAFLSLAARYKVPVLDGFVVSAPAAWTTNHKSCGGTLSARAIPAFAGYLADVVAHLDRVDHIRLSDVSPMNEPDSSQWRCHQEGMVVPVAERGPLVQAVGQALAARAPFARVIADESSLVSTEMVPEVPLWLSTPGTDQWVAAIAHHTYDYPDADELAQAGAIGRQFHKPLWATEVCCFNGSTFGWGYDPTVSSGLWLANTVYSDLAYAHDSAFDWWLALSPNSGCPQAGDPTCTQEVNSRGRNDGLLYYDRAWRTDHAQAITFTKRFWALGNFSRYVRPGAVVHAISGLPPLVHALAFQRGRSWSVVMIDNAAPGAAGTTVGLRFPGGGKGLQAATAVQTSATSSLGRVPLPRISGGEMTASLAAHSITTFVLDRAGPGQAAAAVALDRFEVAPRWRQWRIPSWPSVLGDVLERVLR